MYNGIGLQTPRGSGTNGYIQTNKFLIKARPARVERHEFQEGQGTGGVTRKANKEILEHDKKRQIELKLMLLEEALVEQGYTDEEVLEQVEAARKVLESSGDAEDDRNVSNEPARLSDTQTHQVAARKEKKLDILKAALRLEDVKEGEAFNRELQEQRKQERIMAREEKEREWMQKQLEMKKEQELKEKEARHKERQERKMKEREEIDERKRNEREEKEKQKQKELEQKQKEGEKQKQKELEQKEKERLEAENLAAERKRKEGEQKLLEAAANKKAELYLREKHRAQDKLKKDRSISEGRLDSRAGDSKRSRENRQDPDRSLERREHRGADAGKSSERKYTHCSDDERHEKEAKRRRVDKNSYADGYEKSITYEEREKRNTERDFGSERHKRVRERGFSDSDNDSDVPPKHYSKTEHPERRKHENSKAHANREYNREKGHPDGESGSPIRHSFRAGKTEERWDHDKYPRKKEVKHSMNNSRGRSDHKRMESSSPSGDER